MGIEWINLRKGMYVWHDSWRKYGSTKVNYKTALIGCKSQGLVM
jgi:hypothetical protein